MTPRLLAVAFAANVAMFAVPAHALLTMGDTGIAPYGSAYPLVMTIPWDGTADEHFDVYENGSAVPNCTSLRYIVSIDPVAAGPTVFNSPTCYVPAISPGWHVYDIVYPATTQNPARTSQFQLQVVQDTPPVTVTAANHAGNYLFFITQFTGPTPVPFTGAAFTPNLVEPVGTPTFTLDGAPISCTHSRYPLFFVGQWECYAYQTRMRVNGSPASCTRSGLRTGKVSVTASFEGDPGYADSTGTLQVAVAPAPRVDFDNNGSADIVWTNAAGRAATWRMSDTFHIGGRELLAPGTGWSVKLVGDFTGDHKSDIVFEHSDGRTAMWLMDGDTQTAGAALIPGGTGWSAKLLADLDGDGKADILWEHTDGRVAAWLMDGTTLKSAATLLPAGTGWHLTLATDFDGDGKADILWQHDDGTPAMWLMNGTTAVGGTRLFGAGTGWTAALTADFDGDGRDDIVWAHPDGRVAIWLMSGTTATSTKVIRAAGSTDTPVAAGPIAMRGSSDLVWRKADGSLAFSLMSGTNETSQGTVLAPGYTFIRLADFSTIGNRSVIAQKADGTVVMAKWNGSSFLPNTILTAGTGYTPVKLLD